MAAEQVLAENRSVPAAAQLTLSRLHNMSTQEQDALHTEYRAKYPSLGGL